MARPRKPRPGQAGDQPDILQADTPEPVDPTNRTYGPYSITKPHDHYVIKLGGSVVFASRSETEAEKYIELLTRK